MTASVGTAAMVAFAGGANPSGQSITVDAGADAVYAFWAFYSASAAGLLSMTLGGNSPDQTFELEGTADAMACGVCAWYSGGGLPASGSQTLDPEWDASPSEGPTCAYVNTTGGDLNSWTSAVADADQAGTAPSISITTSSGELVLVFDSHSGNGALGTISGFTSIATGNNGTQRSRLEHITASGSTQGATSENPNYSSIIGISIPDAAGGGASPRNILLLGVG